MRTPEDQALIDAVLRERDAMMKRIDQLEGIGFGLALLIKDLAAAMYGDDRADLDARARGHLKHLARDQDRSRPNVIAAATLLRAYLDRELQRYAAFAGAPLATRQ